MQTYILVGYYGDLDSNCITYGADGCAVTLMYNASSLKHAKRQALDEFKEMLGFDCDCGECGGDVTDWYKRDRDALGVYFTRVYRGDNMEYADKPGDWKTCISVK